MKTFEEIYAMYKDKIYTYIHMGIKSAQEAEDITQEVFLRIYKHLPMYNSENTKGLYDSTKKNKLSTWMYAIAKNLIIDFYRQKKLPTADLELIFDIETMEDILYTNHCTNETPHIVLMNKERFKNVQNKIRNLPRNIRWTAKLFINKDWSYKQISEFLGISIGTVKNNIYRSREILQDELSNELV